MKSFLKVASFSLVTLLVSACGIGGGNSGGTGSIEPAQTVVIVTPDVLDSGERTTVRIQLFDFTAPKVIVKVRYPAALDYITESSIFLIDDQDINAGPSVEDSDDTNDYLVYFIDTKKLGDPGSFELIFQLRATDDVKPDEVEVDVDLDDPDIKNSAEFVVATPQFDVQDSAYIQVGATTTTTTTP